MSQTRSVTLVLVHPNLLLSGLPSAPPQCASHRNSMEVPPSPQSPISTEHQDRSFVLFSWGKRCLEYLKKWWPQLTRPESHGTTACKREKKNERSPHHFWHHQISTKQFAHGNNHPKEVESKSQNTLGTAHSAHPLKSTSLNKTHNKTMRAT